MYYATDDLIMSMIGKHALGSVSDHGSTDTSTPDHYKPKDASDITCDKAAKAMIGEKYILSDGKPREGAKSIVMGCMDVYWRIAALKYLWRFDKKGGKEDLDKAVDCIYRLMDGIYEQAR